MTIDTVFYTSADAGAPTLNNAAGSLNAVLYACLVSGYNAQSVTSLVVAGGVATLTLAGHGFVADQVIEVAGATPSGLNGRKVPVSVASGSLTFDATGIANGTATGSITVKRPSLGWTRPANTSNVAIYARSDVAATPQVLRLDDSSSGVAAATYARASMLETWTDVNTFTGQAPTSGVLSGGQYWCKGANTTGAKPWVLVGDGLFFWLFTEAPSYSLATYGGLMGHAFGDAVSYRAGDTYGTLLVGPHTSSLDSQSGLFSCQTSGTAPATGGRNVAARASIQVGSAVDVGAVSAAAAGLMGLNGPAYPSRVDNGCVFASPCWYCEADATYGNSVRGELPGLSVPLQRGLAIRHREVLSSVVGAPGKVLVLGVLQPTSQTPGAVGISLANWR